MRKTSDVKKGKVNDLEPAKEVFECIPREEGIELLCNYPIHIRECCYDEVKEVYILAIDVNLNVIRRVDYVILNKQFEFVEVLQEEYGNTSPNFLVSSDKTVWVSVFSIAHDYTKEIVLPIWDRSRIKKVKSQNIIPWEQTISWKNNLWGIGYNYCFRLDSLLRFQFDENDLYKKRDIIKTEITQESVLVVYGDKFYIHNVVVEKSKRILRLTQIGEDGDVIEHWEMVLPEQIQLIHPISNEKEGYSFVAYDNVENQLREVAFDEEGEYISDELICSFTDEVKPEKLVKVRQDVTGACLLIFKSNKGYGFVRWHGEEKQIGIVGEGSLNMVNENSELKIVSDTEKSFIIVSAPNMGFNKEKSAWILKGM